MSGENEMSGTPRLGLPFLTPGQAQKEFFHNEALQRLDSLVAAAVENGPQDAPPPAPGVGECYLVGPQPTEGWSGKAGQMATFSAGGWRFQEPLEGCSVLVKNSGLRGEFRGGAWEYGVTRVASLVIGGVEVVASRSAAIASPAAGTTVDVEARGAIDAILAALRHHGLIES